MVVEVFDMTKGDHIYVRRAIGYTHHGIDCGDGTVIHFTGEPGQSKAVASIARTPVARFLDGGSMQVRSYGDRRTPDETVSAAESRLGEAGYHLAFNNCEHFARWCVTGHEGSDQVRAVGGTAGQAAIGAGAAVTAATLIGELGYAGTSAAGIMSGLATAGSIVGGGAVAGTALLGAGPALVSIGLTEKMLKDDATLGADERQSRRNGRVASKVAAPASLGLGVVAVSTAGTAGLSAAGISSGLAAIGGTVGLGMLGGATMVAAAPVVVIGAAVAASYFGTKRWLKWRSEDADAVD